MCEEQQLELCQHLVKATQTLLDKVSWPQQRFEERKDTKTYKTKEKEPYKPKQESPIEKKALVVVPSAPRRFSTSHVLEVEDAIVNKLWEELKQGKLEAQKDKQPPLEEIDFD